jgi:UDP-2,3-diacylglucosamine hydrolase
MRQASRARRTTLPGQADRSGPDGQYADVDHPAALAELHSAQAHTLVHGHTHRPGRHVLAEADGQVWQRLVVSDWDLDHATPTRAEVLRLDATGFTRLPPRRSPGTLTGLLRGVSSGMSSVDTPGTSPEA